jgi:hypothetical protein
MADINVSKLQKIQLGKLASREETYNKIYHMIEKKISIANNGGSSYIVFQVPQFLIGLPLFTTEECIDYLIKRLNKNGFKYIIHNDILIISWFIS